MSDNDDKIKSILVKCDKNKLQLLSIIQNLQLGEQEIYWSRFYSFATLHAGIFILYASDILKSRCPLIVIGLLLGLLWFIIQLLSLRYVDRGKELYHAMRENLGIEYTRSKYQLGEWFYSKTHISSTNIGLIVSLVATFVWIIALIF